MAKVRCKMLRPLQGHKEGATVNYDETDAKRLEKNGAVKILPAKKKSSK